MSTTSLPQFLKWGNYKSTDADKPDIIQVEIVDPEPFETQYDWIVLAKLDNTETNIPLRAKSSNKKLYKQYTQLLHAGKIKAGTKLKIKTWLRKSSKNPQHNLRDYEVNPSNLFLFYDVL